MDQAITTKEYFLKPGYLYYTGEPNIVYSVLGSCVMVCLYDRSKRSAAICHFRYPYMEDKRRFTPQYGNVALLGLIRMMTGSGSSRSGMEAMIFGGADRDGEEKVGLENVMMARSILKKKKIRVVSEDIAGLLGRKVIYHTATNQAIIYKIRTLREMDWYPYRER